MRFLLQMNSDGMFEWRLAGPGGDIAKSEHAYRTEEECRKAIDTLQASLANATVSIVEETRPATENAELIPGPTAKTDRLMRPAFEVIAMAVMQAGNDGVFLTRDILGQRLLDSHLGAAIHARAEQPGRDMGSPLAVAENYVDWFSAHITQRSPLTSAWENKLRRVKISAYSERLRLGC